MKSLVALMILVAVFSSVSAQDAEIKKMSEIDTSEGIVVLDFMDTVCAPCRMQMDELKKVHEKYGDEVRIISVDVKSQDTKGILADYKKGVGAEWEFAIDDKGLASQYRVFAIPTLVILKNGENVYRHMGLTSNSDLIKEIEKVL
jgi:thiol-disulfide isomerase/thioredoxin